MDAFLAKNPIHTAITTPIALTFESIILRCLVYPFPSLFLPSKSDSSAFTQCYFPFLLLYLTVILVTNTNHRNVFP